MALNLVCAVLDRGPASLADMAVLLAIADSADKDTGEAWPSQRTIAARSRQTDRSVRNVLERLRADGWLTWEARRRANGSQASSVYTINLDKLGEAPRPRVQQAEPRSASRRNDVPPPPEPRSAHGAEPRSALEPSQKKEPCARLAASGRIAARSASHRTDAARAAPAGALPQGGGFSNLSPFARFRIEAGLDAVVEGVSLKPGSAQFEALRVALLAPDAEKGAVAHV